MDNHDDGWWRMTNLMLLAVSCRTWWAHPADHPSCWRQTCRLVTGLGKNMNSMKKEVKLLSFNHSDTVTTKHDLFWTNSITFNHFWTYFWTMFGWCSDVFIVFQRWNGIISGVLPFQTFSNHHFWFVSNHLIIFQYFSIDNIWHLIIFQSFPMDPLWIRTFWRVASDSWIVAPASPNLQ